MHRIRRYLIVAAALLALGAGTAGVALATRGDDNDGVGRGDLPQGSHTVHLDPAEFTTRIDNPYWPMRPGSRWVYREHENGVTQRNVVRVTDRTTRIAGVEARVVHDVVTGGGKLVEKTTDWYAQDVDGNVWYLGEATTEYQNGHASTAGSWRAGVDGAQAGIALPADPRPGMAYRQEYQRGNAEDHAHVLGVDQKVQVPLARYRGAVLTEDLTPLEPNLVELKYYARGVGPVLTLTVSGGAGRDELITYHAG